MKTKWKTLYMFKSKLPLFTFYRAQLVQMLTNHLYCASLQDGTCIYLREVLYCPSYEQTCWFQYILQISELVNIAKLTNIKSSTRIYMALKMIEFLTQSCTIW